jgi:hypothetical protein
MEGEMDIGQIRRQPHQQDPKQGRHAIRDGKGFARLARSQPFQLCLTARRSKMPQVHHIRLEGLLAQHLLLQTAISPHAETGPQDLVAVDQFLQGFRHRAVGDAPLKAAAEACVERVARQRAGHILPDMMLVGGGGEPRENLGACAAPLRARSMAFISGSP